MKNDRAIIQNRGDSDVVFCICKAIVLFPENSMPWIIGGGGGIRKKIQEPMVGWVGVKKSYHGKNSS